MATKIYLNLGKCTPSLWFTKLSQIKIIYIIINKFSKSRFSGVISPSRLICDLTFQFLLSVVVWK